MPRFTAMICLIAAMALTGVNVPLGKAVVAVVPIPLLLVFRFAVASLVLAALATREHGLLLATAQRRDWRDLAIMAVVGSVLFSVFALEGARLTTGTDAGIITATTPAVVAGLGIVLWGERPGVSQLSGVALAGVGIGLIEVVPAETGAGTAPAALTGDVLIALAVLCEAVFAVTSRRMSGLFAPIRLSLAVSVLGLVASLPGLLLLLLPHATPAAPLAEIAPATWLGATWYALSASVISTVLWYRGVGHVPTWMAGLATAAIPVAALAASALMLGEHVGPSRLAGAALVIGAIALAAREPAEAGH